MRNSAGKRPQALRLAILLGVVLLAAAGVVTGVLLYLRSWRDAPGAGGTDAISLDSYDRMLPGVTICDIDIAGLTRDEAAGKVRARLHDRVAAQSFTVHFPDQDLTIQNYRTVEIPTLDSALNEAYRHGRDGVSNLEQAMEKAAAAPLALHPATEEQVDSAAIQAAVERYAKTLDSRATDCTIRETEESIEVTKGRNGRSLDVDALCRDIVSACRKGKQELDATYTLTLSGERQLNALHPQFTREAADACWDAETQSIRPEVRGRSFDLEAALEALDAPDGARVVIPIIYKEPELTAAELETKLFRDELGHYASPHTAIAARTTNLTLACQAIDGTVLNPGDVFSFNRTVGERSADKGYQNAAIYLDGQTSDALGGGVCQVASTIYCCALQANLEIVERTEHMYYVTYVPSGQDATVYWGSLDFQFRNSTSYPIRIDASVSGGYVNITLRGTNDSGNYAVITSETLSVTPWEAVTKVDESKPVGYSEVTTTPYTGYVIQTYRNVYDQSGALLSTEPEAKSTYHKRDQVTTVGPEPSAPEPEPEPDEPTEPETPSAPEEPPTDPFIPTDPDAAPEPGEGTGIQSPWD